MAPPSYNPAWFEPFRVDFDVDQFIALIEQKGYRVLWRHWVPCPCVREASRAHRIVCPLCHGTGDRFISPLEIRAVMTSAMLQKEFVQYGEFLLGSSMLTLYAEDRFLGYRDRFDLLDSYSTYAEYRQRSEDLDTVTEFMQYSVDKVVSLFKLNTDRDAYVDLVSGTDYTLNADGSITWLPSGNPPSPSEFFSIVYQYHPSYMVVELVNDIRDTFVKDPGTGHEMYRRMPQRAMVKRSHLVQITENTES